ncbi:hypothetical protein EC991_002031 [Linnemannia zychae]|nr:hypothetical protein EC991_002031 [Linnemannia zychae]
MTDQWMWIKEHIVDRIIYQNDQDNGHDEHGSLRDDKSDKSTDDTDLRKAVEVETETREMNDGEEDPTYYPGEAKFVWDMPHWIPDWLTSKALHPDALWPPQQQQSSEISVANSDNLNSGDDEVAATLSNGTTVTTTNPTHSQRDKSQETNLKNKGKVKFLRIKKYNLKKRRKNKKSTLKSKSKIKESNLRNTSKNKKCSLKSRNRSKKTNIKNRNRKMFNNIKNGPLCSTWSTPGKSIYESKEPALTRVNAARVEYRTVGRYRDNDELRHSVRSAYKFGKDVIRKIYISTADVIEEELWTLWKKKLKEEEEGHQESKAEEGHQESKAEEEGHQESKAEEEGREEPPKGPEAKSDQLFKRDRLGFDKWMEFAEKYGAKPAPAKGLEEDDKYIVADEEPPARPYVRRPVGSGEEAGQVPTWLDRSPASREKIDVVHHSTFFKSKDNLPVYCSVAIESQLYRIPDLSEVFIYMNDDEFFGMEMAQSDFWTPHFGLVLQMNPGNLVVPFPRDSTKVDLLNLGYIDNLYFSNYLLSKRFGFRYRPFLDHIVQVGSRSLLKEVEALWPQAFLQTEKSHFRTDYDAKTVSIMFLMAHYTIERLRETQLRSFWRYRVDHNANGDLEWEERRALVSLIEDWNANGGGINRERTGQEVDHSPQFLSGFRQVLERTGYGDTQEEPATRYVFSGMEGYPFLISNSDTSKTIHNSNRTEARKMQKPNSDHSTMPADRTCIFDLKFCLGLHFLERDGTLKNRHGENVFKRLAFDEFHCGDCLLQIVLQSDRGVEYYLERMEEAEELVSDERVPSKDHQAATASTGTDENSDHSSDNGGESESTNDKDNNEVTLSSDSEGDNNIAAPQRKRDHSAEETILQGILTTQASAPFTTHVRGISAILPSSSLHPKARLRVIKDLYRYNFVMGESDSFFVTLIKLEKVQKDMEYLDKVKETGHKLHVTCLNDGINDDRNGTEIRALLKNFLDDRYGEPAPWEKEVVDSSL